jgi:hypothetical protein
MNRFWSIVLGVAVVGSLVADLVRPTREVRYLWDYTFFFAAYGFLGCALIVYASKAAGKYWLQRRENYYEPHRAPAEVGQEGPESDALAGDETDA